MPSRTCKPLILFLALYLSSLLLPVVAFSPLTATVTIPKPDEPACDDVERIVGEKLERIVTGYGLHAESVRRTMEMEIELSSKTEKCFFQKADIIKKPMLLSEKLRRKRDITYNCLQSNYSVLRGLLLGSGDGKVCRSTLPKKLFRSVEFISSKNGNRNFLMGNGGVTDSGKKETEGYDTALQVITHTARDWTSASSPCRDETYGWIIRSIVEKCAGMQRISVLVPGSGMCRLAYDISTCEHMLGSGVEISVEANDSSVTMAFAARSVLDMVQSQSTSYIHPFVSDPQRNEINSMKRFETYWFPDESALASYKRFNSLKGCIPNLAYTVGDFAVTYSQESKRDLFDVVATCFFLDTSTNIYEYIFTIKHLLRERKNSVWVNCGPLQWHPCAMIRPTVDEFKDILEVSGFELLSWEILNKTVAYRHPDDFAEEQAQYTREEGYRPLRFVARLRDVESTIEVDDLHLRIDYVEYLNGVANGSIDNIIEEE